MTEQERVHNMMLDKARGNETGSNLVWDSVSKTIRSANPSDPDGKNLAIHPSDMEQFLDAPDAGRIILSADWLAERCDHKGSVPRRFRCLDHGDAYSDLVAPDGQSEVPGSVLLGACAAAPDAFGQPDDRVRVTASWEMPFIDPPYGDPPEASGWMKHGFVRDGDAWREVPVDVVPVRQDLFSRMRGLLESGILADKCVFTAGLGSGGAPIPLELAKLGIMNHILMDHDRIEVANVGRHIAGIRDVGRRKTTFMAEKIRDKNPYANVETCSRKIAWETQDLVRDFVRRSDLVICAVDNRDARVILNKICVDENKPMIMAAAFRRAYGGQILFVRPRLTPCYECFLAGVPKKASDEEISDSRQAARIAYSDRPVAIEPGLSNDLTPISQMVVQLALQHLLAGQPTTLRSLDEDLVAPWYIWLNRREADTEYEHLKPLGFDFGGLHVMRWYGVDFRRVPACPCCGSFLEAAAEAEGIVTGRDEIEAFALETTPA